MVTCSTTSENVADLRSHSHKKYSSRLLTGCATFTPSISHTETLSSTTFYLTAKVTSKLQILAYRGRFNQTRLCVSSAALQHISHQRSSETKATDSMLISGVWVLSCLPCFTAQFPVNAMTEVMTARQGTICSEQLQRN